MKPKILVIALVGIVLVGIAGFVILRPRNTPPTSGSTQESGEAVITLAPDQQPRIKISFTADAHYATVEANNLYADQIEYNLIYDATIKGNRIQTGVNALAKLEGKRDYAARQLLGSESSGKFTYHEGISGAVLELTLRDAQNRSIFTASYPFTVTPGQSVDLTPSS